MEETEETDEIEEVKRKLKRKIENTDDPDLLLGIYNLLAIENYGFNWI